MKFSPKSNDLKTLQFTLAHMHKANGKRGYEFYYPHEIADVEKRIASVAA